jgi:TonB family protein
MSRRDPTILYALIAAMIVHLIVLGAGVRAARKDVGWWLQSPQATPILAAAPPPAVIQPPPTPPEQQLGDHDTAGTSINASPGDQQMQSAVAEARQEQAAMQRAAAGYGGKGSARQLQEALRGDNGDGARPGAPSASALLAAPEAELASSAPKSSSNLPAKFKGTTSTLSGAVDPAAKPNAGATADDPLSSGPLALLKASQYPDASDPAARSGEHTDPTKSAADAAQPAAQTPAPAGDGQGGRPGAPDSGAGNPIPTADFESYPVTHVASRFVNGRLIPQPGRKMRMRQLPDMGPAAWADLVTMEGPYVVLRLKIDAGGNVVEARTVHSSGSDNVDLPCERAAYTWWFEPAKDPKTGRPHGEEMEFTIFF